jgi:hypothetical protein
MQVNKLKRKFKGDTKMNTLDFLESRGESYAKNIDLGNPLLEAEAKFQELCNEIDWTILQDRPPYLLQFSLLDLAAYLIAWAELLEQNKAE